MRSSCSGAFPANISHHFPAFPTISRHFPGTPPARIRRPGCEAKFRARLESGRAGASRTSSSRPLSRWQRVGVRVRSMARTVHGGTEALQSFFSAPAWIAWRKEENILPCFRIRQQGECVRITRRESRITAFTVQRSSGISSGANQAPLPRFARNTRHESLPFPSSPLFTIVRYGSPLFGASVLASSAVPGRPYDKRRSPRSSRSPPNCFHRGERLACMSHHAARRSA